jgi:hypothetical protein
MTLDLFKFVKVYNYIEANINNCTIQFLVIIITAPYSL